MTNNAAERALRAGSPVGRKNWLFAGSGRRGAACGDPTQVLATCQLQGVEPWS
ncbi:MAG: transposase, partial [Deltaproteobacteria bacterium]|nr:transposase [Deltaproteobacteria bacterium]